MPKRLILAGFLLGIAVLSVVNQSLVLPAQWLRLVWLILGGILGWWLVWLDFIAFAYILHPEAQVSQYIKFQLDNRRFKKALKKQLFWQIQRPISDKELQWYLYILSGLFLWFVLLLI